MAYDCYKKIELTAAYRLQNCPVCQSKAELWQFSESADAPISKVVMCSHGDAFGPQDGITNEGCLLYMPPEAFYQGRIPDAVRYWNDYAKALRKLRLSNTPQAVVRPHGYLTDCDMK